MWSILRIIFWIVLILLPFIILKLFKKKPKKIAILIIPSLCLFLLILTTIIIFPLKENPLFNYGIVRVVLWIGFILIPLLLLIRKIPNAIVCRIIGISSILLIIGLMVISWGIPIENNFFNFNSPEDGFNYRRSGIFLTAVQGNTSSMSIYTRPPGRNPKSYIFNHEMMKKDYKRWCNQEIIQKTSNGYKLYDSFRVEKVQHDIDVNGDISVLHIKGTNDYYAFGITDLENNSFDLICGYGNSNDDVKINLKRVTITDSGPLVADWSKINE